jgi:hypothetical protein
VAVVHFRGISKHLLGELMKITKKIQAQDAVSGLRIEPEYSELCRRNDNNYIATFGPLSTCNETLIHWSKL